MKDSKLMRVWATSMKENKDNKWVDVEFQDEFGAVAFTMKLHRDHVQRDLPFNSCVCLMVQPMKEA